MLQGLSLAEMDSEGLVKYVQEQQERCRAEPEELPGQDIDGLLLALRRQPVVLVRQIDQVGRDLLRMSPMAGNMTTMIAMTMKYIFTKDSLLAHASG